MKYIKTGIGILLFLIIIVWLVFSINWENEKKNDFSTDAISHISAIRLENAEGITELQRTKTNQWVIHDTLSADKVAIANILSAIRNMTIRAPVSMAHRDTIMDSLQKHGVLVTVFLDTYWLRFIPDCGLFPRKKSILRFWVGEESRDGQATYMLSYGSDTPFEVYIPGSSAELKKRFRADPDFWRDPVVANLSKEKIRFIQVLFPSAEKESFNIEQNESGNITMFDLQENKIPASLLNNKKLERYLQSFQELYYEQYLSEEAMHRLSYMIIPGPFMVLHIEDRLGRNTELAFFYLDVTHADTRLPINSRHDPNRFVLRINEQEYALAQFLVFNKIMRRLSFFTHELMM